MEKISYLTKQKKKKMEKNFKKTMKKCPFYVIYVKLGKKKKFKTKNIVMKYKKIEKKYKYKNNRK